MMGALRFSLWVAAAAVLFNKVLYFAFTCACAWPDLPPSPANSGSASASASSSASAASASDVIRLLVVSDMHVLGYRRRLHVERAWVDWQMRKL